jgi:hypothetical protein
MKVRNKILFALRLIITIQLCRTNHVRAQQTSLKNYLSSAKAVAQNQNDFFFC